MSAQTPAAGSPTKTKRATATAFLRIASLLSLLHCIGHTIGGVFSVDAPPGTPEGNVVEAMKSTHFDVIGATRTFWDFFFGFGLIISVSSLLQSVLFWQLAGLAKTDPGRLQPIIAGFLFANIGYAILAWKFFFAPPFVGAVLIAAALGLAYLKAGVATSRPESLSSRVSNSEREGGDIIHNIRL
jgi:hypothetical protein